MINTQPQVSPTGRYSVADTARILNVHRNTISLWMDRGLLKAQTRKSNGRRYTTGLEIIKIWNDHY